MDPVERLKRDAAARALEKVQSGLVLGLGTGSTMAHFLELLGAALAEGSLSGISGVPTSERTARLSRELRIPLTTLADAPRLDLAVDGADEVDPGLEAIKGLGGALLREKMVAQAADRLCLIVDEGKLVGRLGEKSPVPIEVVRFGWEAHLPALEDSGSEPVLRVNADGEPYVTDNGNYIIDAHFPQGIPDPEALEALLRTRAGVVESGLFLGMATSVVVASPEGTRVMERE
jgi:ribose 5-phosphate isomerase A